MSSFRSGQSEGNQSVEFSAKNRNKLPAKNRHTELNHTYDSVKSPPVPKKRDSIGGGYVIPARRFAQQEDPTEHYVNAPRNPQARNLKIGGREGLPPQVPPVGIKPRTPKREGKVNANSPRPQRRSEFDPPTTMGNLQGILESRMNFVIPIPSVRLTNSSTAEADPRSRGQIPIPRFQKDRRLGPSRQITVPFSGAVRHPTSRSLTTGFLRELETVDPVLGGIFQQCGDTMERYAKQVANGRLIFTSDRFACGMFDHRGGYLPLPAHKVSLYVTPHAIVGDEQEPIFVYVLPESTQEILVFENGEEVISSTIVCGRTGHKFSSDVVLSFPVSTHGQDNSVDQQVIIWEYGMSTDDKPKQQVMDNILDCFYSIQDNRCTLMVNQLAHFTVISKAERRAEGSRSHYPNPSSDESVSLRVGVFGRQIAGTGSAQIRVIFWKDSDLETKRIMCEEQRDGFSKLDRVRVMVINRYRKAVWVTVINVIPGWNLLSKDKENFTVEHILSQNRKGGHFPSCTFALYRVGGPGATNTPHVAACTIEVSQDGGDEDDENEGDTIQLVAIVEGVATNQQAVCDPDKPSVPPRTQLKDSGALPGLQDEPSPGKGLKAPIRSFPVTPIVKPPACLRYKILGELALHLEVSDISGRCWKLLAKNMGLSAPNICCLSERYLCPGEALINWYLGQQVAIVAPREALRRLLDLFREMKWPELQSIMVKELRLTENQNQGLTSSTHLKIYEIIDDDNHSQSPGRSVSQKTEVQTPSRCLNLGEKLNKGKSLIPSPRLSAKQISRGDHDKEEQTGWTGPTEVPGDHQDEPPSQRDYDFGSQRSEKIISPTTSPKGFSYDEHNVASCVKESTPQEPEQSKNSRVPAIMVSGAMSHDITPEEENPYLQPNRKKVQLPIHHGQSSQSARLKSDCQKTKIPVPPARSSSFMMKKGKGASRRPPNVTVRDTSLVDSKSHSKSLISIKDMSTEKQNEHKRTYNTSVIPLVHPNQDYRAPENLQRDTDSDLEDNSPDESTQGIALQDAPSFQTKLKKLHKVVKRNLKKKPKEDLERQPRQDALERRPRQDDLERRPRQDSLPLDDSTQEAIYDDIDGCFNQEKVLTMADASGEQQYGEHRKQLSKDLLAKLTQTTVSKQPLIPSRSKFCTEAQGVNGNDVAVGLPGIGAGTTWNRSNDMISYEDTSMYEVGAQPDAKLSPNKSLPKDTKPCAITADMECYEDICTFQKQVANLITLALTKNLPNLLPFVLPSAQTDDKECYGNASTPVYRTGTAQLKPVPKVTGTDRLKPVPKVKKIPSFPPRASPTKQQAAVDDMVSYEDVSIPEYPHGTTSEQFKLVSKTKTVPQIPTRKNMDYRLPTDDMVTYEDVTTPCDPDCARMDQLKPVSRKEMPNVTRTVTDEMTTYEDVTKPESHIGTRKPIRQKKLPAIPSRGVDNPRTAFAYTKDAFNTSEPSTRIEHAKSVPKALVIPPRYPDAAPEDNYEDISIPVNLTGQTKGKKLPTIPPCDEVRPFADHHTTTRTDQFQPVQGRQSPVIPPRNPERSHVATDDMVSYDNVTVPEHHVKEARDFKPASKKKVPAVPPIPPREYFKPASEYDTIASGEVRNLDYPNEARMNQFKVLPTHGTPPCKTDDMTNYEDMNRVKNPARTRSDQHSYPIVTPDNMPGYEDMTVPQYPDGTGSDPIKVVRTNTGKLMPVRVFVPKQK
ncbi:uncharacterized protein LOC117305231 isoform X2 [Asterias rubens]|uniref:uncharacterized protein LOC117305231 isoform X2 n=1 Tax=Asterias rubens TaxID=7604 RepID=UPI0014556DF4|nr:uncharacterized protein LOC117305231 isoform X2 [Asterias rubens]